MRLRDINLPITSWFIECVGNRKGSDLDKKYGMFMEDNHPNISNRFTLLEDLVQMSFGCKMQNSFIFNKRQ